MTTLADNIEALAEDAFYEGNNPKHSERLKQELGAELVNNIPTILRALRERDQAVEALRGLVDDEPCRHDHHGYCQTHYVTEPCEMHVARTTLASIEGTGHE